SSCLPFSRACASPARVRSRRISHSNSAKMASKPAMARPAGVVRSSASVSETKPTPRCSSSCRVASRSVTERPQRSSRHTRTTVDFTTARGFDELFTSLSLDSAGTDITDLQGDRPAASCNVLPQRTYLHRERLLIVRRNARVQTGAQHFRRSSWLAENVSGFRFAGSPFYRHSDGSHCHGHIRILSGHVAILDITRPRRLLRPCSSTASTLMDARSLPRDAGAVLSGSRTG